MIATSGREWTAAVFAPQVCAARVFVTVEQAQKDMFGATPLAPAPVVLTAAQQERLKSVSSVSLPFQGNRVWRAADGGCTRHLCNKPSSWWARCR